MVPKVDCCEDRTKLLKNTSFYFYHLLYYFQCFLHFHRQKKRSRFTSHIVKTIMCGVVVCTAASQQSWLIGVQVSLVSLCSRLFFLQALAFHVGGALGFLALQSDTLYLLHQGQYKRLSQSFQSQQDSLPLMSGNRSYLLSLGICVFLLFSFFFCFQCASCWLKIFIGSYCQDKQVLIPKQPRSLSANIHLTLLSSL